MSKDNYPRFLSSRPLGVDKLEGGSQSKTAKVLAETIKAEKLEKKVIGLEGEWGAGKSNVIKMLEEQLGDGYKLFIFDCWGNQEDLTRKSFLEQLISELFQNKILDNANKWKRLKNELLAKTSKASIQRFPKVKPHWIVFTLTLLLFTFFLGIYENILVERNIVNGVRFGAWKPILIIYAIPFGVFIWGVWLARAEYLRLRLENNKRNEEEKETEWDTFGKIFYWFQGKEIEEEQIESTLEEEPSVSRFRDYFRNIEEDISDKIKLVIVFDNIDRLDNEKIKSLWSSIHTFFAESTKPINSWVIIPYDSKQLKLHIGDLNAFLSKTFSITFRVTPPVVAGWEKFMKDRLQEAFSVTIDDEEVEFLIKLFDVLTNDETIKPRQIINYVNDLVALYYQWENEIVSSEMKLRYLATFILTKDSLIEAPNKNILSRGYLASGFFLFEHDEELDTAMSSIVFGIPKNLADEVLLERQLKYALRQGQVGPITAASQHSAFANYFDKVYRETSLPEKLKNLPEILSAIEDKVSHNSWSRYWNNFAQEILTINNEFKEFNDNHKAIILHTSKNFSLPVLKNLFEELRVKAKDVEGQKTYWKNLKGVEDFLSKHKIKIEKASFIAPSLTMGAEPFLTVVKETKGRFEDYNILPPENMSSYFKEQDDINADLVMNHIEELVLIRDRIDLSLISNNLKAKIKTLSYSDLTKLPTYVDILLKIEDTPISLVLEPSLYNQISASTSGSSQILALCIGVSDYTATIGYPNFNTQLSNLTEDAIENMAQQLENFCTYSDLLRLLVGHPELKSTKLRIVVQKITQKSYGKSKLDLNWTLKNYSLVSASLFEAEASSISLYKRLNGWETHFNTSASEIDLKVLDHLELQDLDLTKKITKELIQHFSELDKEELLEAFRTENRNFKIFGALVKHQQLSKFHPAFYSAFNDHIKDLAKQKQKLPDFKFWDKVLERLDKRRLKATFAAVRDILLHDRGDLLDSELIFFEKGLILHGQMERKADECLNKIINPIIRSNSNFKAIYLPRAQAILAIIEKSKEFLDEALDELELKSRNDYPDHKEKIDLTRAFLKRHKKKSRKDDEEVVL